MNVRRDLLSHIYLRSIIVMYELFGSLLKIVFYNKLFTEFILFVVSIKKLFFYTYFIKLGNHLSLYYWRYPLAYCSSPKPISIAYSAPSPISLCLNFRAARQKLSPYDLSPNENIVNFIYYNFGNDLSNIFFHNARIE